MSLTAAAALCLSSVIYHEARGEPKQGQIAVAQVVLNRVKSKQFPNTICGVVKQRKQFSWYPRKPLVSYKTKLAKEVYNGKYKNPVGNSLYFHSLPYSPWRGPKFVVKIGRHKFYE